MVAQRQWMLGKMYTAELLGMNTTDFDGDAESLPFSQSSNLNGKQKMFIFSSGKKRQRGERMTCFNLYPQCPLKHPVVLASSVV